MGEGTTIGQSVEIKGDLSASEDLIIEGQVEGTVKLDQHTVTIGPSGRIKAEVLAKFVSVLGKVYGNITATEKLTVAEHGAIEGDLSAPRVGIADGAKFKGQIDMQRGIAAKSTPDTGTRPQPYTAVTH